MEFSGVPTRDPNSTNPLLTFTKASIGVYTLSGALTGYGVGRAALEVIEPAAMEERRSLENQIEQLGHPTAETAAQQQALVTAKAPLDTLAQEYTGTGAGIGAVLGLGTLVAVLAVRKIKGYRITPKSIWE